MKIATFGAGCFWGIETAFRKLKGVVDTAVGYSGGSLNNPTYEQVCTGRTGHAEVVQINYNSEVISYEKLLTVFWTCHDPTQVNRQGPDIGSQYRTVIFYHDESQKKSAQSSFDKLESSNKFSFPLATQIVPATEFFKAEEYHQQYLEKRGLDNCH
tara:strand:+ start:837 stop:1304 length:468 start_codon:yes stop_codon:yes gene_type:complete